MSNFIFDPNRKVIIIPSNLEELNLSILYSAWKNWVLNGIGAKFAPVFKVIGGDPIDINRGIYITPYYYLINGWRLKPTNANYKIRVVNGVLLTDTGDSPFVPTDGNYNVLVEYSQPIKTETVLTASGGGLSDEDKNYLKMIKQVRDLLLAKIC